MNRAVIKVITALLTGVIVMMVIDFGMGKITNSIYAIPFSVFVGALIAGIQVTKNAWVIGLLVGGINSAISIFIYYNLGPQEISLVKSSMQPVAFSLTFGPIGGYVSGFLRNKVYAH